MRAGLRLSANLTIFFIFVLAGCTAPLKVVYNPSSPPPTRAAAPASILVGPFKDGRDLSKSPSKDPRDIGRITATVFDLRSSRLILSEDPAAFTPDAFARELRAAGFTVRTAPDKEAAQYVLTGTITEFRLDIVERDEISIDMELELSDALTHKAVWAGRASVNDSRFAGVMGNTRNSIAGYLESSLLRAIRGTLPGIAAAVETGGPGNAQPPPPPPPAEKAASGSLIITTAPPGAKVYIKGVYQGLTPLTIESGPGVYEVTIKKKGFREIREDVSVRANGTTELPEDLEKE